MMKGRERRSLSCSFSLFLGEKMLRESSILLQSKAEFLKVSGNIVVTKILSCPHFSHACQQSFDKFGQQFFFLSANLGFISCRSIAHILGNIYTLQVNEAHCATRWSCFITTFKLKKVILLHSIEIRRKIIWDLQSWQQIQKIRKDNFRLFVKQGPFFAASASQLA